MKAQPWRERRREYLLEKARLDNLIVMPVRKVTAADIEAGAREINEYLRLADGAQRTPLAEAVRSGRPLQFFRLLHGA